MRISLLLLLASFHDISFCQSQRQLTIVTLDPFQKNIDHASSPDVRRLDSISKNDKTKELIGFGTDEEKETTLDSLFQAFKKDMSFFSTVTLRISRDNNLFLFGKGENIFSYPIHKISNGSLKSLNEIAVYYNSNWVVNPRRIHIETINNVTTVKINIQVYSLKMNKIIFEGFFESNSEKLNEHLNCQEKTLNCCIEEILSNTSSRIMLEIGKNQQHW